MLKLRIISAVVMMSVFLLCFFVLPSIFFRLLIYIITVIVMVEFYKLLEHCWVTKKDLQKKTYIIITVLVGLFILTISELNDFRDDMYIIICGSGLFCWVVQVIPWISKKKSFQQKEALNGVYWNWQQTRRYKRTTFYPIFIILPLACSLLYLFADNKHYLFFVLLIIWLADTGAYFTGKFFGRVKIAENISPGKTLEGVIGGVSINIIFMLVLGLNFSEFSTIGGIVLSFIITLLSIYGDLFVSWIKRSAGVKDAGNLIPGHGGFLDRLDSFLLALPFASVIYYFAPLNFLTI